MLRKNVIIIGSGLSGLSAGCFAQKSGCKSVIFEHHYAPGGLAACWKRKDYLIDGGVHFMSGATPGSSIYSLLKEVGLADPNLYVKMNEFTKIVDERNKATTVVGSDLNKFAQGLIAKAPQDKGFIEDFIKSVQSMRGLDKAGAGIMTAPELDTFLMKMRKMWEYRKILRVFMNKKYAQSITEYSKTATVPWVRQMMCSIFSPEVPAWFVMMLLAQLADGRLSYLKRGSSGFIGAMAGRYKSLGGEIKYRSKVEKILVKEGRAYGVKLENGQEHLADYVISAGDGYNAIYKLLDGKYTAKAIDDRYKTWETCAPFVMASYGVQKDFAGETPFGHILLDKPIKYGDQETSHLGLRITNFSDAFAPKGKGVIQASIVSQWDYWNNLRTRSASEYAKAKKDLGAEILARLEQHYPGITEAVEVTDIATPFTTNRYTLNRRGSWGGWAMNPQGFSKGLEKKLPGLKGFYMAGHWSARSGVHASLYSGKHAVDLLLKDYQSELILTSVREELI